MPIILGRHCSSLGMDCRGIVIMPIAKQHCLTTEYKKAVKIIKCLAKVCNSKGTVAVLSNALILPRPESSKIYNLHPGDMPRRSEG